MKKSILFASSAIALLISGSAFAADALDGKVPTPDAVVAAPDAASYVKVCDAAGHGYFFIPGTEACLRLSGHVGVSVGYDKAAKKGYSSVDAGVGLETYQDSEFGAIRSKLSAVSTSNIDAYSVFGTPVRQNKIDEARVSIGGLYAGYTTTMFNTNLLYGDMLSLETLRSATGDLNSTAIGYMADNLGGGIYAGLAVEDFNRGTLNDSFTKSSTPDFVGRVGAKQDWGNADLSAMWSKQSSNWFMKASADVNVIDNTTFMMTGGYGVHNARGYYILSGAGKYKFSDAISAFAGLAYMNGDRTLATRVAANVGAIWTPAAGFDVKGEVIYSDAGHSKNTYNTKISLVRSW